MTSKSSTPIPTYKKALLQVVAQKNIRAMVDKILSQHNLNTTQWIIINLVNDRPGQLRITDIANALQVEGPFITNLANSLVSAKYLSASTHSKDSRAKVLDATAGCKKLIPKIESELVDRLHAIEKGLTEKDIADYFKILETFINNAKTLT